MMKLAFALALVFYLCYSPLASPARHDSNLNNQMINTMRELDRSVSFPSGFTLHFPGNQMIRNASNCVIRFIRELENLLQNVTVPEHSKDRIEGLMANLKQLNSTQGNTLNTNATCDVKKKGNHYLPFNQYIHFLKKLNSSSRK